MKGSQRALSRQIRFVRRNRSPVVLPCFGYRQLRQVRDLLEPHFATPLELRVHPQHRHQGQVRPAAE